MSLVVQNLQAVRASIMQAAQEAGRAEQDIQLLAVSKTVPAPALLLAAQAGQKAFGESYVQEALDKMVVLQALAPSLQVDWHFIGPIQSNKTRDIAAHFSWVHSVDRLKIAQRLSSQRPEHLPPLNLCLQVNISGEASKSGVTVADAPALAHAIVALPRLRLRGLMAVPQATTTLEQQRQPLAQVRHLQQALCAQGLELDTLSMGMSGDLDAAIHEGATIVRIGTAIFGERNYD